MKIYLYHGDGGHDMAHILASCPLGTNASVGRNLFVRCTRALVHSNAAHGGQKTDGQEETRLGILRPYKVLQWKVGRDCTFIRKKAVLISHKLLSHDPEIAASH